MTILATSMIQASAACKSITAKFTLNATYLPNVSSLACACFRIAALNVVFPSSVVLHTVPPSIDWDFWADNLLRIADHRISCLEEN